MWAVRVVILVLLCTGTLSLASVLLALDRDGKSSFSLSCARFLLDGGGLTRPSTAFRSMRVGDAFGFTGRPRQDESR